MNGLLSDELSPSCTGGVRLELPNKFMMDRQDGSLVLSFSLKLSSPIPLTCSTSPCRLDRAFTRNCTAHELNTSVVTKLLSFFLATFLGVFKADLRPQYSFSLDNFLSKTENGYFWPRGEQDDFKM